MSEEYLDTNNNSNAVNKMMTRLMNATASLHSSSNNHGGSGEATPLIVATAAAGSTVNESGAASSSSSSSLTSLIKVSSTVSVCASPGRLRTRDRWQHFYISLWNSQLLRDLILSFFRLLLSFCLCWDPQVSPLKSLLREDLKRRINARASNRASRNNTNNNNNGNSTNSRSSPSPTSGMGGCNSTNNNGTGASESQGMAGTTSNGVITSTGPENDLIALNRKRNLQCLFCGIEFPDQTLYFLHKGCHSESNPWKCNICGEQMNNVYEFNSHLLSKSHQ